MVGLGGDFKILWDLCGESEVIDRKEIELTWEQEKELLEKAAAEAQDVIVKLVDLL